MFSNEKKLELIHKISNINNRKNKKKYYIQLFNIINKNNVKYTNNLNGIFFNLNNLDNATLQEVELFLNNIENEPNISETETTDN